MKDKIVLLSCPVEGNECKEHRMIINRDFYDSQIFFLNKDYSRSILALKNAFQKTSELQKTSCHSCAEMFRNTITQSLENIHSDLNYMTTGMFSNHRFHSSLKLAGSVLKEIKSEG